MENKNSTGRELQLLKKVNGSLELDQNVLKSVLTHPNIGDRPISIVSIAGAFRTGKSFMLNFFLLYLTNKGYENPRSWIGNPLTPLKDGIQWRGGSKADTCGINIWSEPFIVKMWSKEIAVILLDTQGNSDHTKSRESELKVFVLSALLSSTFIYNISNRIKMNDLEYLQFFVEHAKARERSDVTKTSFQLLWFLIRDWNYPDEHAYGSDGGKKYLQDIFESRDESLLKEYLRTAFERVNCYLMPEPGEKVKKASNASSISVKDIDPEFVEHLHLLTECFLDPESLVVKRIEGKIANGSWLAEYILQCWNQMNKEGLPSSDTLMEVMAKSKCQDYVDRSIGTCKTAIKKIHTSYVNDHIIKEIGRKARNAALEFYDGNARYGGERIVLEYKKKLERAMDLELEDLTVKNKNFKHIAQSMLSEAIKRCHTEYRNHLLQCTGEKWTDPTSLANVHRLYFDKAKKSFSSASSSISCKELLATYNEKLVDGINQMYLRFTQENTRFAEKAKMHYKLTFAKCIEEHKKCLEKVLKTNDVADNVLSEAHEEGKAKALNLYTESCRISCPEAIRKQHSRNSLLGEIKKNEKLFRDKNRLLRERREASQSPSRRTDQSPNRVADQPPRLQARGFLFERIELIYFSYRRDTS